MQNFVEEEKKMTQENDFGFTEEEINIESKDKIAEIKRIIWPLLEYLKKDPEKENIKWSNRVEVIDLITKKLEEIMK